MTGLDLTVARPARPWPATYAIARAYLDARRTVAAVKHRPRSHAFIEGIAKMATLRNLADDLGIHHLAIHANDVLADHPIAPGPEWLIAATADLYRTLEGMTR